MTSPTTPPTNPPPPESKPSSPAAPTHAAAGRSVLPDQTGDDLDVGWGDRFDEGGGDDERFLRERPPHWE